MLRQGFAQPGSSITLDKKVVVDHGPCEPYREASHMDLRCQVAALLRGKQITVSWIPAHQTASAAHDAQELDDMHRNNEVDRLAKLATTLPLPLHTPETLPAVLWGELRPQHPRVSRLRPSAPTPNMRACIGLHGCLCAVCAATCGYSRCGVISAGLSAAPLGKLCKVLCPLCSKWHRGTTHARLAQCDAWLLVFVAEWVRTWDTWGDLA